MSFGSLKKTLIILCLTGAFCLFGILLVTSYQVKRARMQAVFEYKERYSEIITNVFDFQKAQLIGKVLNISRHPELTEGLDLGSEFKVRRFLQKHLTNNEKFGVYDFEGDPLEQIDKEFYASIGENAPFMISRALAGKVLGRVELRGDEVVAISSGPVGDISDPSGVLVVVSKFSENLYKNLSLPEKGAISFFKSDGALYENIPESGIWFLDENPDLWVPLSEEMLKSAKNITALIRISDDTAMELAKKMLFSILALFCCVFFLSFLMIYFVLRKRDREKALLTQKILKACDALAYKKDTTLCSGVQDDSEYHALEKTFHLLMEKYSAKIETYLKNLQKQRTANRKLFDLASIDDVSFRLFLEHVEGIGIEAKKALLSAKEEGEVDEQHLLELLFHFVSTIFESSKLFRLDVLQAKAKDFEHLLMEIKDTNFKHDQKKISQLYQSFNDLNDEIDSHIETRTQLLGRSAKDAMITNISMVQIQWLVSIMGRMFVLLKSPHTSKEDVAIVEDEFDRALTIVGRVDMRDFAQKYNGVLEEFSSNIGKQINPIIFSGNCPHFDKNIYPPIHDIIVRFLRNAVQHGIEGPMRRKKLQKAPAGTIEISSNIVGGYTEIVVRDDGRGVDLYGLLEKLKEENKDNKEELSAMENADFYDLLSQVKNEDRGFLNRHEKLGLKAASAAISRLRGRVAVTSVPDKGTIFKVMIPNKKNKNLATSSVFDISLPLKNAIKSYKELIDRAKITINPQGSIESSFLVYGKRRFFIEACHKFILGLIASSQSGDIYEFGIARKRLECDGDFIDICSIFFQNKAANDIKELSYNMEKNSNIKSLKDSFITEPGYNICFSEEKNAMELRMITHFPKEPKDKTLHVLTVLRDQDATLSCIHDFVQNTLSDWNYEIYLPNRKDEFIKHCQDSYCLAIIQSNQDIDKIMAELKNMEKIHFVILAEDVSLLEEKILNDMPSEPVIIDEPIDSTAITRALEETVFNLLVDNHTNAA